MNFINIYNPNTQSEILDKIGLVKKPITIWQSLDRNKKVMRVTTLKLNPHEKQLILIPKEDQYTFSSQLPIYFHSPHRNCIFKTTLLFNSGFKIISRWPDSFMIEDERHNSRSHALKNQELFFSLKINKHHYKEFNKPLIDQSKQGVSIRVPSSEIKYFDEKAPLKLRVKGEIRHAYINYIIPHFGQGNRGFFKVGIVLLNCGEVG